MGTPSSSPSFWAASRSPRFPFSHCHPSPRVGSGKTIAPGRTLAIDSAALYRRLTQKVAKKLQVNSYSTAAGRLELEHQVCRFYYLRWVNRLLTTLQKKLDDEWTEPLDEVRQLLQDLPPEGGHRIYQLYRQVKAPPRIYNQPMSPLGRLQKLLPRLSDNWSSYRLFLEQDDVPATNDATERTIGR